MHQASRYVAGLLTTPLKQPLSLTYTAGVLWPHLQGRELIQLQYRKVRAPIQEKTDSIRQRGPTTSRGLGNSAWTSSMVLPNRERTGPCP